MSKAKNHHKCMDCSALTNQIGEHYFVHNSIWNKVHNSERGMLCVGCLEKRLGRELVKADFTDCHVNRTAPGKFFSERLWKRLTA